MGLLLRAVVGLTPKAVEAIAGGLDAWQWGVLLAWLFFMAYTEGYRGFQKRFSPMVAARIQVLYEEPTWLRVLLAPAFAMGLFDASRRRLAVSWFLLGGIALLVIFVRHMWQPWRGIVDAGVVLGLTWGVISLGVSVVRVAITGVPEVSPELPGERDEA